MFSCCMMKTRRSSVGNDDEFRWKNKKGEHYNGGYSGEDNHGSEEPGYPRPIFFIDSGESTNTDSPKPLRSRNGPAAGSAVYDVNNVMTSGVKLDPNSKLQRNSKLHNEKLPSFSAFDRTKRPRTRREDATVEGENSYSLAYEPLTFETFRSNSPPLAVIAPLAKAKTNGHNASSTGHNSHSHHPNSKEREKNNTMVTSEPTLEDVEKNPGDGSRDSHPHPHPKLTHQISISRNGMVSFQRHGLINRGYFYSEDDLPNFVEKSSYTMPETFDKLAPSVSNKTSGARVSGTPAQRPTTLPLASHQGRTTKNLVSFKVSGSKLPGKLSRKEPATLDSNACSRSRTKKPVKERSSKNMCVEQSSFIPQVPQFQTASNSQRLSSENDGQIREEGKSRPDKTTGSSSIERSKFLETIPEITAVAKKTPPPKPKRRNPPSNAGATAFSRNAITERMTSEGTKAHVTLRDSERVCDDGVTSPGRHCDVSLRHGDDDEVFDMDNILLMPPESFMDCSYAGLDSFDEINGSLV